MRRVVLLSAVLLAGCRAATETLPRWSSALVGEWRSNAVALQPRGAMERVLLVYPTREVRDERIARGVYAGQQPDALSMRDVLYGRIDVGQGSYVIHPDSEVTEDAFSGSLSHSVNVNFSGWSADTVHFTVAGPALYLEYLTYPADAPVATRDTLYYVPVFTLTARTAVTRRAPSGSPPSF